MEPLPLIFIGTEEPVTMGDIDAIEQEYNITLPADYKSHILLHNGGWPKERDTFLQSEEVSGSLVARTISDFYSVRYGDERLEDALEDFADQLHPDLVPFGSETGGDQFLLSVGLEDYGSIYYISHEFYTPPKRKDMKLPRQYGRGVSFLTTSFTDFLNSLVTSTPA